MLKGIAIIRLALFILALLIFPGFLISGCQIIKTDSNSDETALDTAQAMEKGDQLFSAGKLEAALAEYLIALVNEADNISLLERIAYIYETIGNEAAAEYSVRQILQLQPDHGAALKWMGLHYLKTGKMKEAKIYFNKAFSAGQNGWQIHNAFGLINDLERNYTQAREYYKLSLEQVDSPKNTSKVFNNLGYSYYLSGEMDKALNYFDKALVSEPDSKKALANKGLVYVRLGRERDAEHMFFQIMDKHEAYNNIGFLNMIFKNHAIAERYFKLAIHSSPIYYKEAQDNLYLLRRNQMK